MADYSFVCSEFDEIITKVYKDTVELQEIVNFKQGIITGNNKVFLTEINDINCKKVLTGKNFNQFIIFPSNIYVIYNKKELHRPRKEAIFEASEKLILRQTGSYPIVAYDNKQYYTLDTVHNGLLINNNFSLKYIMILLNSKLMKFIYSHLVNETGKVFAQVKIMYVNILPCKQISLEKQKNFIFLADKIMKLAKEKENQRDSQKKFEFLKLEVEIDARVAQLYNLTEEEYAIVLKDTEDDFRIKALNFHRDLLKGIIT